MQFSCVSRNEGLLSKYVIHSINVDIIHDAYDHVCQISHPTLYDELRDAWLMCYPDLLPTDDPAETEEYKPPGLSRRDEEDGASMTQPVVIQGNYTSGSERPVWSFRAPSAGGFIRTFTNMVSKFIGIQKESSATYSTIRADDIEFMKADNFGPSHRLEDDYSAV